MIKLSLLIGIILFLSINLIAQVPQSFKFQAIARDINGNVISNQQIRLRISLIQNNENGDIVYSESHFLETNQFGLINLEIGRGINKTGDFANINWGISKYFVLMEMDVDGGDNYVKMGVSQLLSVPYALYAESTGSSSKIATCPWEVVGNRTYLKNPNSKLSVGTTKAPGKLTVNQDNDADALIITGGGLGKNLASFIRDVGSNGRIDFNVCGADPQIKFDVEGGGTKWFIGVDDSPSDYFQIGFGGTSLSGSNKAITIDDVNGNVGIGTTNPVSDLDVHGTLQVENGTSINEISTDNTLAGDSDDAVPTEKAVKAYIDALESRIQALSVPVVITTDASEISYIQAISGGNILITGLSTIIARGVCWSTTTNPTIADNFTIDGSGTGSFTSSLSVLIKGTTYYVRAYATNNAGTAYGNEISFTTLACGNSFVDARDGHSYNAVLIGNQCWMAENLAYLPSVGPSSSGSETVPYYYVYWYNGTDVTVAKATYDYQTYGVLYNWPAAMDGAPSSSSNPSGVQGACPNGWHLPSEAEWLIVINHLGGANVAGGKMKETGKTHWSSPNTGATNSSGFTALPGGYHNLWGVFDSVNNSASFWSSTEYNSFAGFWRYTCNNTGMLWIGTNKDFGFSVRCLED